MTQNCKNNRCEFTYACFAKLLPVFAAGLVAATIGFGTLLNMVCPDRQTSKNQKVIVEQVLIINYHR